LLLGLGLLLTVLSGCESARSTDPLAQPGLDVAPPVDLLTTSTITEPTEPETPGSSLANAVDLAASSDVRTAALGRALMHRYRP
jgi:hypothetical protein